MTTFNRGILVATLLVAAISAGAAPAADKDAKAAVQAATKGKMKPGKGTLHDAECGQQIQYEAEAVDLNGDGQLEVLTREFGSCFGMAGVRMDLYIRSRDGSWKPQFGFPGDARVLKTKNHGFPDIEIVGPGQCFPVWRYDGKAYQIRK
jgi:hypothetical protein